MKDILLTQDRLMSIEDQSAGIHEEIHFWQERLLDLQSIRAQLQRHELQNIIRVLNMSKSAYMPQFVQTQQEIQVDKDAVLSLKEMSFQEFTAFVEDCLTFLKILAEPSRQLNDVSIEQLSRLMTDIFYRILIAWHHSSFFASSEKIRLIISKVRSWLIQA